ncbi:hypothetical protein FBU59_002680 [Linderina macrospora]|uniref:Uncharacterized protein n=1 Tax=Linderina macrospora TaxID=4868 RepID=A0ACC1JAR5_9FUNG|nr:hypothetical protein FBU59_002680 [Linderina macrospora]
MKLLGYQLSPVEHNSLLATLDADGHGTDIAEKLRARFINNASLGASLVEQYAKLESEIDAPGAFRKAKLLLSRVMGFFTTTFGDRRTIVLIDEFDTPFTFLATKVSDDDVRESIEDIFKEFYSSLVKVSIVWRCHLFNRYEYSTCARVLIYSIDSIGQRWCQAEHSDWYPQRLCAWAGIRDE